MTRTYRMYVDTGISDRTMDFLRNTLSIDPIWKPERYRAINFSRRPGNNDYFEYELNFILDGTEINSGDAYDPEDPEDVERYYETINSNLINQITSIQIATVLLSGT